MSDIVIPKKLKFLTVSWRLAKVSKGGGASINGNEQIVDSAACYWTANLTFSIFTGLEDPASLIYRSLIRRGRAGSIIVPDVDVRGPLQFSKIKSLKSGVRHSDGTRFSDKSAYSQPTFLSHISESVQSQSTVFNIFLSPGLPLSPGMRFSFPDNRKHEIDEVISNDGQGNYKIRVLPWLRADYGAMTFLNFTNPACRMRMVSDQTGTHVIEQRSFTNPSLDLREAE